MDLELATFTIAVLDLRVRSIGAGQVDIRQGDAPPRSWDAILEVMTSLTPPVKLDVRFGRRGVTIEAHARPGWTASEIASRKNLSRSMRQTLRSIEDAEEYGVMAKGVWLPALQLTRWMLACDLGQVGWLNGDPVRLDWRRFGLQLSETWLAGRRTRA